MITIDGTKTEINIISLKRKADFLDKYAERSEDGVLHREPIGVFYNYQIKFGWSIRNEDEYDRFSYQLSAPDEFHSITMPYGANGDRAFEGYCSGVSDEMFFVAGSKQYWRGLTASFIAKSPSRAYGSASPSRITIPINKLTTSGCRRRFDTLDKSADRSMDGVLDRELIGVYHNYQLKFGWSYGGSRWYHDLWEILSAPVDFHTVTIPDKQLGSITQEAYFSNVSDELFLHRDGEYYWRNLTANVIARSPTRAQSAA